MFQPILPVDLILRLPTAQLALRLLETQSGASDLNFNSMLRGTQQAVGSTAEWAQVAARLSDAWSWLEAQGLIGPSATNPAGGHWQRVTAGGLEALKSPQALSKLDAERRLSGDLHPSLRPARTNFELGDYETACFAAMKAVEVEVRRAAELGNDLLGVSLMRKAFSPKDGVLRDLSAEPGEQQATADLFAGAIGSFKNPASHRTVEFEDPLEAAQVLQLADLLLRITDRAADRAGRD